MGDCFMSVQVSFGVMEMFWALIEVMAVQHCECNKYFKMVNCMFS